MDLFFDKSLVNYVLNKENIFDLVVIIVLKSVCLIDLIIDFDILLFYLFENWFKFE